VEHNIMGSRHKLNQGYVQGCLLFAGILGWLCHSWAVFWIAAFILISLSFHSGEIRPQGDPPRNRRSRRPRRGRHDNWQ
jgi:hypothetical protein